MERRGFLGAAAGLTFINKLPQARAAQDLPEPREQELEDIVWLPQDASLESENIHILKEGFDGELTSYQDDLPEGHDCALSTWRITEPFPLEILHMVETADEHSKIDETLEEEFGDLLENPSSDPISIRERGEGLGEACRIGIERHGTVLSVVEVWVDIDDKHRLDTSLVDIDRGVTKPWR